MGRTKGSFGSSSPRGKSFGDGGKLNTKPPVNPKKKVDNKKSK